MHPRMDFHLEINSWEDFLKFVAFVRQDPMTPEEEHKAALHLVQKAQNITKTAVDLTSIADKLDKKE